MSTLRVETRDGLGLYAELHEPSGPDGIPILFSPAFSTTHENWRGQVAPLTEAGARVVLWDYRGHGRSDAPDDPERYAMDLVVDDIGRVLSAAVGDTPAVLAGLSFGGLASLHFTVRSPERVRGLVLVAAGPGFKNPDAAAKWMANTERTAAYIEAKGFEAFVNGKAGPTCIGNDPDRPAARAAAREIIRQSPAGVAHFARRVAGPAPSVIDALSGIDVPALVLVGAEDRAYHQAAEVMAAKLPRARLERVPGGGHILNIDAAERFDALVTEFLAEDCR